jgi:hypothetical protein
VICLFCRRVVPSVPMIPVLNVAHVDEHGVPCLEGAAPEAHASALADYPREELNADEWWDLGDDEAEVEPVPDDKLQIVIDDAETRALWNTALRAKAEVAAWPAWKRGETPDPKTATRKKRKTRAR